MFRNLFYLFVLACLVSACNTTQQHIADADIIYNRAEQSIEGSDEEIADMIGPYKEEMDAQMNEVLGYLNEDLKKSRPNSNMGNWFCDALLYMAEKYHGEDVAFAAQNYGGLRVPFIGKGELTKGKVYELMPFDNMLVILEMSGEEVKKFLDNVAGSGGWPISRGVSFKIMDDQASNILIDGKAWDAGSKYLVALPDYVANGGDGSHFLKDIKRYNTGVYIRDVIIEFLKEMQNQSRELTIDNTIRIN